MIRPWNRDLASAALETLLVRSWEPFCIEEYNISRPGSQNVRKCCACHESHSPPSANIAPATTWISWLILITYEASFTMRRATRVTLHFYQILRLPGKVGFTIDAPHIWNVIYHARKKQRRFPTSRNTAPARKYHSHDWSTSHMKRHLHCAEQAKSPFKFSTYGACHVLVSSRFELEIPALLPPMTISRTILR